MKEYTHMYKLINLDEGHGDYQFYVETEENNMEAIISYLEYKGILFELDVIKQYVELVVDVDFDGSLFDYVQETIDNFVTNSKNINAKDVIKHKIHLYSNDIGDWLIPLEKGKYRDNIPRLNKLLEYYGLKIIEEIMED